MVKSKTHANRGMKLEKLINKTNEVYKQMNIAQVNKIPTNVKIMSNKMGRVSGFVQRGEMCDYVGVYRGQALTFDAKQTKGKSLPMTNIHENQLKSLSDWSKQGSLSFIIINFTDMDRYFIIDSSYLDICSARALEGGRKSISLEECENNGKEIFIERDIGLNYLAYWG